MLGDWDGAKRTLEGLDGDPIVARLTALFTDQQRRERERAEVQAVTRHELGNALAIAQANMEALLDGVLEITPERLTGIRDAMKTCGVLLEDLKKQSRASEEVASKTTVFDVCELLSTQIAVIAGIAESKSVSVRYEKCALHLAACRRFSGDPDRVALVVRDVLLGAVRYTPPGGAIDVRCASADAEIQFSVSNDRAAAGEAASFSVASKLLGALGAHAHVVEEQPGRATFVLRLPASAVS